VFRRALAAPPGTAKEISDQLHETVRDRLPDAEVFVSDLGLLDAGASDDGTEIGRLLLVDRETILVSSFYVPAEGERGGERREQAVFGRGFDNGLVAIVRRLLTSGLLLTRNLESDDAMSA